MEYLEEYRCPICTTRHPFHSCRRFLVLHPSERARVVDRYNACQNCLGLSHNLKQCYSGHRCHVCKARHHTLLHCPDDRNIEWLQMTAYVKIQRPGIDKEKRLVRALLDPNVKVSQAIVTSVNFPYKVQLGLGYINLQLTDRLSEVRTLTTSMEVVRGVAPFSPHRPCLQTNVLKKFELGELADFSFNLPYGCCLILGEDVIKRVYLGMPQLEEDCPYAQKTIFGFALFGPIEVNHGEDIF